jgi:carboxyl-terminal processing protease
MKSIFGKVYLFRILVCLPLFLPPLVKAQQPEAPLIRSETDPVQNLKVFDALWEKVNTKYFDSKFSGADWAKIRGIYRPKAEKAINKTELLAVLRQMLSELNSSHLDLWQTVRKNRIEKKISTNFDPQREVLQLSYGFSLKYIEGRQVVTQIIPNLTKPNIGWSLISADGQKTFGPNVDFGETFEGRKVDFVFLDTENKEHNISLAAGWSVKKNIPVSKLLAGKIGYVRIEGFSRDMGKWLETELQRFASTNGVIIDLRSNRGGFVEEVKRCLSQFFVGKTGFGTFIERSGKIKATEIKGKQEKAYKGKLVVLVDDESFSGAEIFAQLIKETGRGKIVGTQTRGLVLNSAEFDLPGDFKVSIAIRNYLSPQGYRLETKGVRPDFEISLTIEDLLKTRDPALEKAVEVIK